MSKYKEGDKFIIEIDDVLYIESAGGLAYEPWYLVNGMEGTYFEEDDLDSLERYDGDKGVWNAGYKTGYDKGYQEGALNPSSIGYEHGYEAGLNDAWECAKKIVLDTGDGGLGACGRNEAFGLGDWAYPIMHTHTVSEAIEKLREYEAKKDEIKVGDEVRLKDLGLIGVVTRLADLEQAACIMFDDGSATWKSVNGAKKTGRHFPIEDILEQMRSE